MTTSEEYFKKFVQNISPDEDSSKNAQDAHSSLRDHLEGLEKYSNSFLYGSYRRSTAIHNIDDVDICILLDIDTTSEEGEPKKILRKLKKDISNYYTEIEGYDEDNTSYNRRSILVKNALPEVEDSNLTLDVIPAVQTDYDYLLVPDREKEKWVKTNPLGHVEFSRDMNTNEKSNGLFLSVVKAFKHLKKIHIKGKHPKGFWIETFVGLNYKKETTIVESFYSTLCSILNKYGEYKEIPDLDDLGIKGETIKTSMEYVDFEKFITLLKDIKDDLEDAIKSNEKEYSLNIFRSIFGEKFFPITLEKEYSDNTREEFITKKYGYIEELDNKYFLHIYCSKTIKGKKIFGNQRRLIKVPLSSGTIEGNQEIQFEKNDNCPNGTIFLWKVRNYGIDASKENALRGEIGMNTNSFTRSNFETVVYHGTHTVECFAIFNNKIIAKDLFRVHATT